MKRGMACVGWMARIGMRRGMHDRIWTGIAALAVLAALTASGGGALVAQAAARPLGSGPGLSALGIMQPVSQWPTYLQNNARTGFNGSETRINITSASSLKLHWSYTTGGPISVQPVEANNQLYLGSWDGYERALTLQGQPIWSTYLGQTTDSQCDPTLAGVASTPAITPATSFTFPSKRSMLYVGGGDGQFYALDALTGAVQWVTRLGPSPSTFIWSSPLIYAGSVYIGVSSLGDCPLVQGQLVQLNAATGAIQHTFNVVPDGCTGGGVWGSPTIDVSTNTIYFATGNAGSCSTAEPYSVSLIAVSASSLALVASWQIPLAQQGIDGDFGSTPTLFTATINTVARSLVGLVAKNGVYYAFDRTAIATGPVWTARIAQGGECPQCGAADIAPSAWDGQTLYEAGGTVTINGQTCSGSVWALDPATGSARWSHCLLSGPVLAAVTVVAGVVFAAAGSSFFAFAASSGNQLFTYTDVSGQPFYGAASVAAGSVNIGNMDGTLFCFGV